MVVAALHDDINQGYGVGAALHGYTSKLYMIHVDIEQLDSGIVIGAALHGVINDRYISIYSPAYMRQLGSHSLSIIARTVVDAKQKLSIVSWFFSAGYNDIASFRHGR